MAAAGGKKSTTPLPLFMVAFGLEVEEELFTMVTPTWAEGTWIGKWYEQKNLDSTLLPKFRCGGK